MRKGTYGPSSVIALFVAMSIVATAFVSLIVYFESTTGRVRRETEGMLSNGVPSAGRLTEARATLRGLDGAMDKALLDRMEQRPVDLPGLHAARTRLADAIAAYRALPSYAMEAEFNRTLDFELGGLDDVMKRLTAELVGGHLRAAHELENGEWRRRSDQVDDRLRMLITLNIDQVTHHALRIDRIRRRAAVIGLGVGGGALLLAFVATIVAMRAIRRQTLLQEERARELEMFSARVAHDLMSPLQSVSLALELGREHLRDPALSKVIVRALAVLKRVRSIVDDLLEFARAGGKPAAGAHAPVSTVLSDVIDELRPTAERAGVELRCATVAAVEVACAPGILTVVVTNLINNAVKHMGEQAVRLVCVSARDGKDTVCFEVEDTGPGLDAGFGVAAFEPYVRGTTTAEGLGLGLATVKRLVDAHGGRLGVRRRDGEGALFWFELPRAPAAAASA
jgi:signal transduction histidine kinase